MHRIMDKLKSRRPGPRRGFTMVEMLIVVVIIGLLIAITVPAIHLARKAIETGATEQLMASLTIAMEAYKQDHRGFPPSDADASSDMFGLSGLSGWPGAALMTQAVTGASASDGKKGLGFRVGGASTGPVSGPYMDPGEDELKEIGGRFYFVDQWDQPILYYRAEGGQFQWDDNPGLGVTEPDLDNHPQADEAALNAAGYVLYSLGKDRGNATEDEQHDDVIVLEP